MMLTIEEILTMLEERGIRIYIENAEYLVIQLDDSVVLDDYDMTVDNFRSNK